jgi:hypothetical protein
MNRNRERLPFAASVLSVGLVACGSDGEQGPPGAAGQAGRDGASCRVEAVEAGARIACSNDTSVVVRDGEGCVVVPLDDGGAAEIQCADGTTARVGAPAGACTWTPIDGGVAADCPDGSRFVFRDEPETPPAAVRLIAGVASVAR